jgi:hypothetical protein
LDGEVKKPTKIKTCRQILSINSGLKVYYTDLPSYYDEKRRQTIGLDPEQAYAAGILEERIEKFSYKVFP